jgi:TPR repeat protein
MRRMIETAPQDGKFVILEEDARGNYDVARWSSEAGGWVGEDGEPINITPTHWHPTQGENHLQQGLDFSFFLRRAAEQRVTAGDVLAACSVAADPVTRAEVGAQTTLVEAKRVSQARWRFAATVLAASLVAAAFTGMYFRAQVTYEVAQLRKVADAKATELQQERDHSAALASELATVRRDFETTAALLSKAGRKVAEAKAELKQEPDHTASLQSRAPAAGAPVAAPPARKLDPDELATLMNRAKILVAAGDISPARLLLERAAEAQEPTAALMLARTYDPDVLRTENVRNIIPDPAMARIWYQRAAQLGSADAQRRLSQWEN